MATVSSNIVTPQQAALNKKKATDPMSMLMSPMQTSTTAMLPQAQKPVAGINYSLPTPKIVSSISQPAATSKVSSPAGTPAPQYAPPPMPKPAAVTQNPPQNVAANGNPAPQEDQTSRFTGLLEKLVNYATSGPNAEAAAKAGKVGEKYAKEQEELGIFDKAAAGDLSTGTQAVGGGNAQIKYNTKSNRSQALTAAENAELAPINAQITAAGQGQTGLISGLNAAQPIQVPYSNQVIDPATGKPIGGGASGSMNDAVQLQVQKVLSGQSGYNDAATALQAYGQAGTNALQQALGPNFNINESNANAAAKAAALQQNVSAGRAAALASDSAKKALDSLQASYLKLNALQGSSGVPAFNALVQMGSLWTGIGRKEVSDYVGALNEARAQVRGVLGAAGVNPIDAGGIADTLLPSNMIPTEVPSKIQAAKSYLDNRVAALSNTDSPVPQYGGNGGSVQAPATGFSW